MEPLNEEQKQLVAEHIDLPPIIVHTRFHNVPIPHDELIDEGNLGLMRASQLYSPDKNCTFRTWASLKVWSYIAHFIRVFYRTRNGAKVYTSLFHKKYNRMTDQWEEEWLNKLLVNTDLVSYLDDKWVDQENINKMLNILFARANLNSKEREVILIHDAEGIHRIAEKYGTTRKYIWVIRFHARMKILEAYGVDVKDIWLEMDPKSLDR